MREDTKILFQSFSPEIIAAAFPTSSLSDAFFINSQAVLNHTEVILNGRQTALASRAQGTAKPTHSGRGLVLIPHATVCGN